MSTIHKLPDDIQGSMSISFTKSYPLIKIGEYENFIQKFVATTEETLFESIRLAKKYGIKGRGVDSVTKSVWNITAGITIKNGKSVNEADYTIVFPTLNNSSTLSDSNIDFPFYMEEQLTDSRKEYVAYLSIVPSNILNA